MLWYGKKFLYKVNKYVNKLHNEMNLVNVYLNRNSVIIQNENNTNTQTRI